MTPASYANGHRSPTASPWCSARRWPAGRARRPFAGAGRGFEDRFADVMRVAAVVQRDVQVAQAVGRQRLPEVFDQLTVELPDLRGGERGREHQVVAPAQVDGAGHERLFHRQREVAVAADARLVAQRLLDGLADADADVLDRVVLVDLQVARGAHRQVDGRVPGQQREHVVEEADAGGDLRGAGAVEVQLDLDLGFGRLALDAGGAGHGQMILANRARQASICSSVPTEIRRPSPQP